MILNGIGNIIKRKDFGIKKNLKTRFILGLFYGNNKLPYVQNEVRKQLDNESNPTSAGQLNYVITHQILKYISNKNKNYELLNEVVGVLECCKQELYRRIIVPYEDNKMIQNGDVYV